MSLHEVGQVVIDSAGVIVIIAVVIFLILDYVYEKNHER